MASARTPEQCDAFITAWCSNPFRQTKRRVDNTSGDLLECAMSITTINAYAVTRPGGSAEPFSYQRALGSHDALVRVTHCSIARGDVQFIDNDWGDTRFPLVPGHEIVGLVAETGSTVTG